MTYLTWICGIFFMISVSALLTICLDFSDNKEE